jgi:hypothetical protein
VSDRQILAEQYGNRALSVGPKGASHAADITSRGSSPEKETDSGSAEAR